MSSKKRDRELLLRVIAGIGGSIEYTYMGVGAVEYPITGDTIGGLMSSRTTFLFDFTVDQEVTARQMSPSFQK